MKTVVITGSARGFGLEMLKVFRKNQFNCVITDVDETALKEAYQTLNEIKQEGKILKYKMDVTKEEEINSVLQSILKETSTIDIWINNAGVNQPDKYIWELESNAINQLIDIDLKGCILCTSLVTKIMLKQGYGAIYNVEGHGSNDSKIPKLTLYGTSKRAVTYFTESLAIELKTTNVLVGKITPGIMKTNFINTSLGNGEKIEISEKTKKIYNILGDYPETIAEYIVPRVIANTKNNTKIAWLTNRRAMSKFISSIFHKRDIF